MASSDTNHEYPRSEPRYRLNDGIDVRVLVQAHGSPEPVDAQLIDMSNSGVQLRLATCLKFDESMAVHILAGDLQFDLAATVKWIRQADEQSWSVGCHIKPELSEEALNRLASMGLLDRRDSVRKQVELAASVCGELEANRSPAVIRNLSEDGFGMATMAARVVGQRIRVAVPTPYGETIDVTARVIWQIKTNRGFFCGCAFLGRESHGQLLEAASGVETAEGRARRRRRVRSATRTSMWVALAALVVFVFPSLIVVLMDERGAGDARSGARDAGSGARGESVANEAPTVASAAPPRASSEPSDASDPPSEPSASSTIEDANARPLVSPVENEDSGFGSRDSGDSFPEPMIPNPDPLAPLVSPPIALAAPDAPDAANESGGPQDDDPASRAPRPAPSDVSPSDLPPEVVAELSDWLGDRFGEAMSLAGELNRLSHEASAKAGFGIEDSGADAESPNPKPESRAPRSAPRALHPAAFRTWTDTTGRYRVLARIEGVENGTVRLLKENGRYATVPLDRLSKDDAEYARRWAESR